MPREGCGTQFGKVDFLVCGKVDFLVCEGIVLGHLVSKRGIEVDKAKVEVIKQRPPW